MEKNLFYSFSKLGMTHVIRKKKATFKSPCRHNTAANADAVVIETL